MWTSLHDLGDLDDWAETLAPVNPLLSEQLKDIHTLLETYDNYLNKIVTEDEVRAAWKTYKGKWTYVDEKTMRITVASILERVMDSIVDGCAPEADRCPSAGGAAGTRRSSSSRRSTTRTPTGTTSTPSVSAATAPGRSTPWRSSTSKGRWTDGQPETALMGPGRGRVVLLHDLRQTARQGPALQVHDRHRDGRDRHQLAGRALHVQVLLRLHN